MYGASPLSEIKGYEARVDCMHLHEGGKGSTLLLYSLTNTLCLLHSQHLQVGCISLISCTLMAAQQVMGPVSLAPSMAAFEGLQP
jgi:hypothetical protein